DLPPGKRMHYDKMNGHVQELLTWATELPAKPLCFPLLFSFARDSRTAIPLHRLVRKDCDKKLTFRLTPTRYIRDLILCQMKDEHGNWSLIKAPEDIFTRDPMIPSFIMKARYGKD